MSDTSERAALQDLAARVLPGSGGVAVERTATGVSTPVYRIRRDEVTLYLRLSETSEANLAPEVLVHNQLLARGVWVPEIVYFDPFHEGLQRSVMVTTEIPGGPISHSQANQDLAPVAATAGQDLAVINSVAVDGFGWIRRNGKTQDQLAAELPSLREFALRDLETHLTTLSSFLSGEEIRLIQHVVTHYDPWFDANQAILAHGDFDAAHIFHLDGEYTGIIDFGEIRGTDRFYDLGHFALHDGEKGPAPLLPHLLMGYNEVFPLPPDHDLGIQLWSVLIGIRALARSANRPKSAYQNHLAGAIRRALGEMGR